MVIENLLNKRCLIKENSKWGNSGVEEIKILEISPSRNWVKVMNMHGNKYWKSTSEFSVVEVLLDLKTGRPKD